jgi:hypothetical protein
VLLGNGDGTFQPSGTTFSTSSWIAGAILAGDLNGDGSPDLVTMDPNDNTISVLMNKTVARNSSSPSVLTGRVGDLPPTPGADSFGLFPTWAPMPAPDLKPSALTVADADTYFIAQTTAAPSLAPLAPLDGGKTLTGSAEDPMLGGTAFGEFVLPTW